ncbi:MAG: hypothetical protein HY704_08870 [Gemmatimonadetes bacterium]|nr:hypothetical protein [Gemmatimonadota bacterium]
MHQRDYLLRMIEQAGEVLIRLRNRILGRVGTAAEIDRQLRSAALNVGLDLDIARMASADTLAMIVAPTGEVDPTRCWFLAEMLYLDGLSAELEGRPEDARGRYAKAIRLFSMVEPGGAFLVGFPEAAERIQEIGRRLGSLSVGGEGEGEGG